MNWTLIVAICTFIAAVGGLLLAVRYHRKDVTERADDRRRQLRDFILQTALELDGNAQTSRIFALNALRELSDMIPEEHIEQLEEVRLKKVRLEKWVSELEKLTDMAEGMRKAYLVDDSSLSLEFLEEQLYVVREAALNVGTVMRQIELITERR